MRLWYSEISGILEQRWQALQVEFVEMSRKGGVKEEGEEGDETLANLYATSVGDGGMSEPSGEERNLAERFRDATGWPVNGAPVGGQESAAGEAAAGLFRSFRDAVVADWSRADVDRQWAIWTRIGVSGEDDMELLERGEDGVVRYLGGRDG